MFARAMGLTHLPCLPLPCVSPALLPCPAPLHLYCLRCCPCACAASHAVLCCAVVSALPLLVPLLAFCARSAARLVLLVHPQIDTRVVPLVVVAADSLLITEPHPHITRTGPHYLAHPLGQVPDRHPLGPNLAHTPAYLAHTLAQWVTG
jgi:hypothetical protein